MTRSFVPPKGFPAKGPGVSVSRRSCFHFAVGLGLGLLALTFFGGDAVAKEHKARKDIVGFQNKPNGTQSCATCKFFLPEQHACQKVEGAIQAYDWCGLYQRKSS